MYLQLNNRFNRYTPKMPQVSHRPNKGILGVILSHMLKTVGVPNPQHYSPDHRV